MTLVLDLQRGPEPRLHALVIGCGRFPHLPQALQADRRACYDSAVEMVAFLAENAERLEPKLGRIDCLLADPAIAPGGQDVLPGAVATRVAARDPAAGAALATGTVEPPTAQNVRDAFDRLVAECRPGDGILVYGCSHGVAGRDETGLLVLEDVHSRAGDRWEQVLNMKSVASALPAVTDAGAVWVFLDACQEIVEDLRDRVGGVPGMQPVAYTARDLARAKVKATALAAARFGSETHAPPQGGIAYFTRALLDGVGSCCVEKVGGVWKATAKELVYGIEKVAKAIGLPPVEVTTLVTDTKESALMAVPSPSIPIHISSIPARFLDRAVSAFVLDGGTQKHPKAWGQDWRFRVPVVPASYKVSIQMAEGGSVTADIEVRPPAVSYEVTQP